MKREGIKNGVVSVGLSRIMVEEYEPCSVSQEAQVFDNLTTLYLSHEVLRRRNIELKSLVKRTLPEIDSHLTRGILHDKLREIDKKL